MTMRWHLLTGEYPPQRGGVGQFASVMAQALAETGVDVHVWTCGEAVASSDGLTIHRLPDRFGPRTIAELEKGTRAAPGRVVLHYTPNALGSRGANVPFCRWFAARGRSGWDARVLFHEPFLYFGRQSVTRNLLAVVHRLMAAALLRASDEVYLSTPSWRPLLQRYSARQHQWRWIPISVGTPPRAGATAVADTRLRLNAGARFLLGTFGTYAAEITGILRSAIAATTSACPDAHVVCLGRNSREFVASLTGLSRVSASGELTDEDLSAALAACDLILQPFPEGVTCRRTSLLRSLAAGAPVVTTAGRYTESIWQASGAVSLVPVGRPDAFAADVVRLLADPAARTRLGDAARLTYDASFSPTALIQALGPCTTTAFASSS